MAKPEQFLTLPGQIGLFEEEGSDMGHFYLQTVYCITHPPISW